VRRMVSSKASFSPEDESGFVGFWLEGWGFVSFVPESKDCELVPVASPKIAFSRSSGLTPCFSMALVNSSKSLPILEMSSAEVLDTLGSGFRFPRTEDISDARRAMKSSSDSAGWGANGGGGTVEVFPEDEGLPGPDAEGVGCCGSTLACGLDRS
jgi:hypothetical protein